MRKLSKEKAWQAVACLACTVVLWIHLDDFRASEFSGGWLTGPLLGMAELGSLFFVAALVVIFFLRRTSATIALVAVLLCFPLYLYILIPGLFRRISKGEYSVPLHRPFHWDTWAAVGVLSLLFVAVLSVRGYSRVRADI
jgi:hypothetical protein